MPESLFLFTIAVGGIFLIYLAIASYPKNKASLNHYYQYHNGSYIYEDMVMHETALRAYYKLYGFDLDLCSAQSQYTPTNLFCHLAKSNRQDVKYALCNNSLISIDVLSILAKDPDNSIRCRVAKHLNCNAAILESLANDPDDAVRFAIARNKNASKEILMKLVNDKNKLVKEEVLKNPNCPAILKVFS
jgi:hypothetical protein